MANSSYKILNNEKFGRYMVANRNLKQGELILTENPVFLGPQHNGPARCFKCLKIIIPFRCSFCFGCGTALTCSNECNGTFHSKGECLALKNLPISGDTLAENNPVIFPLRCFALRLYSLDVFKKVINLESHLEKRRNTAIWRRCRITVEDVMKEMELLSEEDLKNELVQKLCGILDVNTFEVRPPHSDRISITKPETQCLRGLYLEAAMMAHDCLANSHLSVDDNFVLRIYASIDIEEGQPILFNYANTMQGTQERQLHLQEGKYFTCQCKRCKDPTEFETEINTLICPKCRKGLLKLIELEDEFRIWKCSDCEMFYKTSLINLALDETKRQIEDSDLNNLKAMENLHQKFTMTFHPNHYLLLELKQHMIAIYANLPKTKINLTKKIDLCGRLLAVFNKLEAGISRIKALTMYELQSAIVDLANKEHYSKEITETALLSELQRAEKILKESVKYLLYEPTKSPEGRMAQVALKELKMLRRTIDNIRKDILINGEFEEQKEITTKTPKKIEMSNLNVDTVTNIDNKMNTDKLEENDEKKSKKSKRNQRKKIKVGKLIN